MKKSEKAILLTLFCLLVVAMGFYTALKLGWLPFFYGKQVAVYFALSGRNESRLAPVSRTGPEYGSLENRITSALESLIAGPNEEEKQRGFDTGIPPLTKVLNIWLQDGIAYLSFSRELEEGGGTREMEERLAQIVFTATQFPRVSKVRFLIEGKFIKYFGGEGITDVERPLGREDFAQYLGSEL
jgi:spore germination protein GerM